MAALVIRDALAVLRGVSSSGRSGPSTIFSSASRKSFWRTVVLLAARGEQRRLVDQVPQVGAREARRRRGELAEVRRPARAARCACAPSRIASRPVLSGRFTTTRRSKRPGPQQRRSSTSGWLVAASTMMPSRLGEAVHLGQDLVQRLLLLARAADRDLAARAADRVELVDEDDRRRVLARLLEQVAHARRADADDHLDELGGAHREERHAGLAGDGAREQRLAGARRADQQHALRRGAAEARVLLRVACRKSTISTSSFSASSMPATSSNVTLRVASPGRSGAPCSCRCPISAAAQAAALLRRAPEHPDVERRSAAARARSRTAASTSGLPLLDRLGADLDAVVDQECLEAGVDERRQLGREGARGRDGRAARRDGAAHAAASVARPVAPASAAARSRAP